MVFHENCRWLARICIWSLYQHAVGTFNYIAENILILECQSPYSRPLNLLFSKTSMKSCYTQTSLSPPYFISPLISPHTAKWRYPSPADRAENKPHSLLAAACIFPPFPHSSSNLGLVRFYRMLAGCVGWWERDRRWPWVQHGLGRGLDINETTQFCFIK